MKLRSDVLPESEPSTSYYYTAFTTLIAPHGTVMEISLLDLFENNKATEIMLQT